MTARTWTIGGCLFCVTAIVWHFAVSPLWLARLSPGWVWKSQFIGTTTYVNEDGTYPADDVSAVYERVFMTDAGAHGSNVIPLELRIITRDPDNGKVTWETSIKTPVNIRSGHYAGADHHDDISVFPRHTQKKDYRLRVSYMKGLLMSFAGEEEIAGLTTYLFQYKGRGEYTESYAGTEEYEGTKIEPGQEIKCNDDQYISNFWIEPTTGEAVKWEESCQSGDAIYDIATGKKITDILRWGGVSRGDDILDKVQRLRWERLELLAMTRYVPGLLLLMGIAMLIASYLKHRTRRHQESEE